MARRFKRDYSGKRFSNPASPRGGARRWRGPVLILGALAATAGWAWFAAFSDVFRVNEIRIEGNESVPDWEIMDAVRGFMNERRWLIVPQKSLLVISEERFERRLYDLFLFETAEVVKDPPRALRVTVKERVSSIYVQMPDGGQALLDLDGFVIRTFSPKEAADLAQYGPPKDERSAPKNAVPVLFNEAQERLALRDRAFEAAVVDAVVTLPARMEASIPGARVSEIRTDGAGSRTLRIVTSEGWSIYVDASADLDGQLASARIVLEEKVAGERSRLDYIDVRFDDKVFFKVR